MITETIRMDLQYKSKSDQLRIYRLIWKEQRRSQVSSSIFIDLLESSLIIQKFKRFSHILLSTNDNFSMSSAPKTKKNNQQLSKNNQPNAEENTVNKTETSNLVKNIPKTENTSLNKQIVQPITPTNLTIVRQASFSSQDGGSRHNAASRKSKSKKQKQKQQRQKQQNSLNKIKQNDKKVEELAYDQYNVLKISGLLDAYQHFLKLLCKHGLPTGKIYDYAAQEILKYEKKKINKELKMRAQLDIQKILKKNEKGSPSPQRPRQSSPYYH